MEGDMIMAITWDLCTIDWTAVSAIASAVMVFVTSLTLCQNRKQLKELRRQWEEERMPNLIVSLGIAQKGLYLKINNVGMLPAYNVKLQVNEDFLTHLEACSKKCFNSIIEPFYIDGRSTKYVYIAYGNDIDTAFKDKQVVLKVSGTYCNDRQIDFTCNMDEIAGKNFARIVDDLTEAVEGIEKSISSANAIPRYDSIQKSLHIISSTLSSTSQAFLENKSKDNKKNTKSKKSQKNNGTK